VGLSWLGWTGFVLAWLGVALLVLSWLALSLDVTWLALAWPGVILLGLTWLIVLSMGLAMGWAMYGLTWARLLPGLDLAWFTRVWLA
jgi:hypothetical protein